MNAIDLVLDNGRVFFACGEFQQGWAMAAPFGELVVKQIARGHTLVQIFNNDGSFLVRSLSLFGDGGWRVHASGVHKRLRETPPYKELDEVLSEFGLGIGMVESFPDREKRVFKTEKFELPGHYCHFRGDHTLAEMDDPRFLTSEHIPNCFVARTGIAVRSWEQTTTAPTPTFDMLRLFLWPGVTPQNVRDVLTAIRNAE